MKTNLTLALPKQGRLAKDSFQLLKQAGISFEMTERSLQVRAKNFDLDILLLRSNDIPEIVADGVADIGITGQNIVTEKGYLVKELELLGFGKCSLRFAFPENEADMDLENKRIATSYPQILTQYLEKKNITAQIVELSGSIELAPKLKIADCVCDLVSTGSTLKSNGLKQGNIIFESQAVIIGNNALSKGKQALLSKLLLRIKAVLTAQKYKYIVMNAERKNIAQIETCIPGLKRPTVSPLANSDFVSVASVVEEDFFWSTVEKLKDAGASGILVLPIEKIIL